MTANEDKIVSELQTISRILTTALIEGGQRDKIEKLSAAGFSTGEIARLIGARSKTVSAELIGLKKRNKKRKA